MGIIFYNNYRFHLIVIVNLRIVYFLFQTELHNDL